MVVFWVLMGSVKIAMEEQALLRVGVHLGGGSRMRPPGWVPAWEIAASQAPGTHDGNDGGLPQRGLRQMTQRLAMGRWHLSELLVAALFVTSPFKPEDLVIIADIGEELAGTLHGKEVGSQHLGDEAGWTKVSGKGREKLGQSNKAQQTSKGKMSLHSNQKLGQNRDFGPRMRGVGSRNSPSTPDFLGDVNKQQISELKKLPVEGHRQTGQQPDYQGVVVVEANGHSGSIWVLCSNSNISMRVLDVVDQCISFEITIGNPSSYCSVVGQFSLARAEQFTKMLEDCGLFDIGAIGRRFTWYRKVRGGVQMAKKLDRPVINQDWRLMFPEAYNKVLVCLHSDHFPLFTRNIVHTALNKGALDVVKCLLEVQKDATSFNKKVFGNIFVKKRELERLLNDIQIALESREDQHLRIKEKILYQELNFVLQDEILWYQKFREQCLSGERGTRFMGYFEDGCSATETSTLEMAANFFFQKLFSTREDIDLDAMGTFSCLSLSIEACQKLVEPVTSEEVKRAVMTMILFKAPWSDGFQAIFYKEFWNSLSNDVCVWVKRAFEGELMNAAIFDTLIVLIPKVEVPSSLRELRPISLCNVIYKIVTKVLVNRFRPFLSEIIGPLQGGFIPGRRMTENIIITQEIMHFMRNTKSQKGTMAFKIDLEKAYDRVDWHFFEATLVRFGFSKTTINLILNCVTSSSLAILLNRNRLQNFNPKRGLRQGDSISPYLFVFCMKMLACFMSYRVFQGSWNPVAVSRNGP
ncbi:uncharacterized protein LOC107621038 [Arachis ipaensis]|uniref:uncharacterized protein LOC107621038 n=1 Tax=Arachis ipaensis TaxID=130454 RepID=UPI0007AFBC23|nr:uncharacterized protein LOC107621038 [Arachis ipaensis]